MAGKILITPSAGSTTVDPTIAFQGAGVSTDIVLRVPSIGGLSFEGVWGQLFSISDSMSGTIYSVNDVSGIPSIEVLDTGLVKIGQYGGNLVLGSAADNGGDKLQINGSTCATITRSSTCSTTPIACATTCISTPTLNATSIICAGSCVATAGMVCAGTCILGNSYLCVPNCVIAGGAVCGGTVYAGGCIQAGSCLMAGTYICSASCVIAAGSLCGANAYVGCCITGVSIYASNCVCGANLYSYGWICTGTGNITSSCCVISAGPVTIGGSVALLNAGGNLQICSCGYYMCLGPLNSTWAHMNTNATSGFYMYCTLCNIASVSAPNLYGKLGGCADCAYCSCCALYALCSVPGVNFRVNCCIFSSGIATNQGGDPNSGVAVGGLSLWSDPGGTTSWQGFRCGNGSGWGVHGSITSTEYATYNVMDTTGRGWIWRNATTGTNHTSISNTGVVCSCNCISAPIICAVNAVCSNQLCGYDCILTGGYIAAGRCIRAYGCMCACGEINASGTINAPNVCATGCFCGPYYNASGYFYGPLLYASSTGLSICACGCICAMYCMQAPTFAGHLTGCADCSYCSCCALYAYCTCGNVTGNAATVSNASFTSVFCVSGNRTDGNDYNQINRVTGAYAIAGAGTNGPGPTYLSMWHINNGSDVGFQIAGGYNSDQMWFRGTAGLNSCSGFTTWRNVVHSGNSTSYCSYCSCCSNCATCSPCMTGAPGAGWSTYAVCSCCSGCASYAYTAACLCTGNNYQANILYATGCMCTNGGFIAAGYLCGYSCICGANMISSSGCVIASGYLYTSNWLCAASGVCTAGNVVAYNASDCHLKEKITVITCALAKVQQLRGVEYDWNEVGIRLNGGIPTDDGKTGFFSIHDVGVIAQEVERVMPEAVRNKEDGYKGVRYEKLIPLLIEAIKEQQVEIELLQARV